MQIQYIGVACTFHQLFGNTERGQQFHAFRNQVFFTHRCPDIAIDNIGAFYCIQIICNINFCTCFTSHFVYLGQYVLVNAVNQRFWANPYKVHTHFGTAVHPCIAHIVSHIARKYYFYLIQRFGNMFFNGKHVCQNLCRVVCIG